MKKLTTRQSIGLIIVVLLIITGAFVYNSFSNNQDKLLDSSAAAPVVSNLAMSNLTITYPQNILLIEGEYKNNQNQTLLIEECQTYIIGADQVVNSIQVNEISFQKVPESYFEPNTEPGTDYTVFKPRDNQKQLFTLAPNQTAKFRARVAFGKKPFGDVKLKVDRFTCSYYNAGRTLRVNASAPKQAGIVAELTYRPITAPTGSPLRSLIREPGFGLPVE